VLGFGFRVLEFGFWVLDFGFGVLGFGVWVWGLGFGVLGFGFWVLSFRLHVLVRVSGDHETAEKEAGRHHEIARGEQEPVRESHLLA
jgi:hypothetical protein